LYDVHCQSCIGTSHLILGHGGAEDCDFFLHFTLSVTHWLFLFFFPFVNSMFSFIGLILICPKDAVICWMNFCHDFWGYRASIDAEVGICSLHKCSSSYCGCSVKGWIREEKHIQIWEEYMISLSLFVDFTKSLTRVG
jgi:hypothetical protein